MNNRRRNGAATSAALARVQLIEPPLLKELTRKNIKRWETAYEEYVRNTTNQGEGIRPNSKMDCIQQQKRDLIALLMGTTLNELTNDQCEEYLSQICNQDAIKTLDNVDEIFTGIRMKQANQPEEVQRVCDQFCSQILQRINDRGLRNEFADAAETTLRKLSFPKLFDGIQPQAIGKQLRQKWMRENKNWTLAKFMAEVTKMCGEQMLVLIEYRDEILNSLPTNELKSMLHKRGVSTRAKTDKPTFQPPQKQQRVTKQDQKCTNCGRNNHATENCWLHKDKTKGDNAKGDRKDDKASKGKERGKERKSLFTKESPILWQE